MKTYTTLASLAVLIFLSYGGEAYAQKATEIYIPIGQSPGLSDHYSKIGTVTSIDEAAGTLVVTDSLENTYSVEITDSTRIWLDKSRLKKRNETGTISDIKNGLLVEVKYNLAEDSTYAQTAEWVKVQVTESPQY